MNQVTFERDQIDANKYHIVRNGNRFGEIYRSGYDHHSRCASQVGYEIHGLQGYRGERSFILFNDAKNAVRAHLRQPTEADWLAAIGPCGK